MPPAQVRFYQSARTTVIRLTDSMSIRPPSRKVLRANLNPPIVPHFDERADTL
jgi:hypothetical protein